jgi:hypothetical protein
MLIQHPTIPTYDAIPVYAEGGQLHPSTPAGVRLLAGEAAAQSVVAFRRAVAERVWDIRITGADHPLYIWGAFAGGPDADGWRPHSAALVIRQPEEGYVLLSEVAERELISEHRERLTALDDRDAARRRLGQA